MTLEPLLARLPRRRHLKSISLCHSTWDQVRPPTLSFRSWRLLAPAACMTKVKSAEEQLASHSLAQRRCVTGPRLRYRYPPCPACSLLSVLKLPTGLSLIGNSILNFQILIDPFVLVCRNLSRVQLHLHSHRHSSDPQPLPGSSRAVVQTLSTATLLRYSGCVPHVSRGLPSGPPPGPRGISKLLIPFAASASRPRRLQIFNKRLLIPASSPSSRQAVPRS